MRSFRAEHVSDWVKCVLDLEVAQAQRLLGNLLPKYPIVVTRSVGDAKAWIRSKARANERFGLVVSSQAQRRERVVAALDHQSGKCFPASSIPVNFALEPVDPVV